MTTIQTRSIQPRNRRRPPRKGAVLLVAMILITVVLMLVLSWLQVAALQRRTFRALVARTQAEWLVESGIERAVAQLAADPQYAGETWKIPAENLHGQDAAEVTIEIQNVADEAQQRQISVRADYPLEPHRRQRRSKSLRITLAQGES